MSTNEPEQDPRFAKLVGDALGPLLPTTEQEVERAEADGVENVELPRALKTFKPRDAEASPVAEHRRARHIGSARGWITHGAVAIAGMAAGAALLYGLSAKQPNLGATPDSGASKQANGPAASTSAGPIDLRDLATCDAACCGGVNCTNDTKACPSGQACIGCDAEHLMAQDYRLKLGSFAPNELGKKALANGKLEICARASTSDWVCGAARNEAPGEPFLDLPLVLKGGEAMGGITVAVRYAGAKQFIAEWSQSVAVTPGFLCKGTLIQPALKNGDAIGTLSLFLVDSYFVELARKATVTELRALEPRLLTAEPPAIRETTKVDNDRFALTLGPFPKATAERIRWALLDKRLDAKVVLGEDFKGEPRP